MAGGATDTQYAFGWLLLLAQLAAIVCLVVFMLIEYPNPRRTPWYTYLTVGVSWTLSISSIVLLPLDIASFLYSDCTTRKDDCVPPINYVGQDALRYLWGIIYWGNFILSWFVLAYQRSWIKSGAFTIKRKVWLLVRFNVIKWAIVLFVVFIAFLAVPILESNTAFDIGGWSGLVQFLVSLINIYGLTFVLTLLGVGMVEIPRKMWQASNIRAHLDRAKLKIYQLSLEKDDSEARLGEVIQKIFHHCDAVEEEDPLTQACDTLLYEIPEEFSTTRRLKAKGSKYERKPAKTTLSKLENLRQDLRSASIQFDRACLRYAHIIKKTYFLEDCLDSMNDEDRRFKRSFGEEKEERRVGCCAHFDYWWYIVISPILGKVGAVVLICMAAFIILNEVTAITGRNPDITVMSLMVRGTGDITFLRQIFIVIPLAYMCCCIYYSLFKWKVLQLYRMHRKRHTEGVSLLFNAYFVGRFTPAVNYNFLDILHFVDQSNSTVYSERYGRMDLVPYLDKFFRIFFPCFLIFIVVLATFDVWNWVWNKVYRIALEGTKEERIQEGSKLLEIERRKDFGNKARKKRLEDARRGIENGLSKFDSLQNDADSSVGSSSWM